MSTTAKVLSSGKTARAICEASDVSEEGLALFDEAKGARAFVDALISGDHHLDTVRFLAHGLPPREGVWWAWWCARRGAGDAPPAEIVACLDATKQWIADPTDKNRRAAMEHAEAVDFGTAAGCAGLSAFLCGDSLAPPDLEKVPPAEYASAKAVGGAVMLAALVTEPEKAPEKFRAYIEQGLEVAEKIHLWKTPDEAAKARQAKG